MCIFYAKQLVQSMREVHSLNSNGRSNVKLNAFFLRLSKGIQNNVLSNISIASRKIVSSIIMFYHGPMRPW